MRPTFLAGGRVRLVPLEPEDAPATARLPWRLLSRARDEEAIVLVALEEERLAGLLRLEALEWPDRSAALACRWAGGDEGAADALRLALAYARDELGLRRLVARVVEGDEPWPSLLRREGFLQEAREGRGATVLRHGKAFGLPQG